VSNNFLARIFDWLGEAFEKFNPSAYRFIAAILPYLTPFPVAWLTAHSSEKFLGFTPEIAFIFVVSLEGIGLWLTSLFVDGVVDWIRSRNWKTGAIVLVLGSAVSAYIYILVSLNVSLESVSGVVNPIYSRVVTLLCFLPLITGIGNGYYKLKLRADTVSEESHKYQLDLAERIRKEKNEARRETKLINAGIDPRSISQPQQFQTVVSQPSRVVKSDWRLLDESERELVRHHLTVPQIMEKHNLSRSSAFEWKKK